VNGTFWDAANVINPAYLLESVFPSRLAIPRHQHTNSFFCFILEGWSTTAWERQTWISGPSTLTLFPADLAHANRWGDSGGRVLNVEFDRPWLQRLHGPTTVLERAAEYQGAVPSSGLLIDC